MGQARIVKERGLIARITADMDAKYAERQWKAEEMPRGWVKEIPSERRAFIEFTPEKVDSWDNRKVR